MRIKNFLFNLLLYNYSLKRIATLVLKLMPKIFFYNLVYKYFLQLKMRKYALAPARLMIENTNVCMANCSFCPHGKMKRKLGTMEMRLYKKIVDEGKNMGISQITLHGFGEPLTDKYFFDKVRYAKRKGISKVTTNTNGILLDFEKIKKIFESGLDEIYISFDAASELTYRKIRPRLNFSQIEENIRQLTLEKKKREVQKPKIFLSFVETKENISEEEQYLKRWGRLVDGISISKMHNWAGGIKLDFEKAKKDPCRLLWTDMVVSWDGKVPLCCNDYENRVILGDLNSQNISEVWQGEKLKKIRGKHQKSLFNEIKLCANCQSNFHYRMPWWGV